LSTPEEQQIQPQQILENDRQKNQNPEEETLLTNQGHDCGGIESEGE